MRNCLAVLASITLAFVLASAGCGDNSRACGMGTKEVDGFCMPTYDCGFGTRYNPETDECVPDSMTVCSDGTVFDELTHTCKLDDSACQAGTVLVGGACVDPTGNLVIDVEEGPEPNGLGVIEPSAAQAGNIVLKPSDAFVVHGTLNPFRDSDNDGLQDPDVDTYLLTTAGPTFLTITSDGVNGTAGGFAVLGAAGAAAPLDTWQRVGLSLISDAATREILLPAAGTYRVAVADSRTLLDYVTTGTSTTAPGSDTSEYFLSLQPFTPGAPTVLALTNKRVTVMDTKPTNKLAFYTAPFGTGLNAVDLTVSSSLANEALDITNNGELVTTVATDPGPSRAFAGGLQPGDQTVIVVDHVYSLAPTNVAYTLSVAANDATPLSTTGAATMENSTAGVGTDITALNQWSFETTADDVTVGLDLTFSTPVVGQVYDEAGMKVATFTSPTTNATWTTYRGLLRLAKAGRYYFLVFAPGSSSSTVISATSTLSELTPMDVIEGTVTAPIAVNAFRVLPFTYDRGTTDAWQQFNVTGVNTGGQTASWFEPQTAFGRLDALTASSGAVPTDATPVFTHAFAAAGGAIGRVVISDPSQTYFVKVNATTPTTSPTVTLDFGVRALMADLGSIATGSSMMRTGDTLTTTVTTRFYLFRAPLGASVTVTVTPGVGTMNTSFRRLNADETTLGAVINNGGNGAADSTTFTQTGASWTAIAVTASTNLSANPGFTLNVQVQ